MRVALTGTPGTGKTTVAELLDVDLAVVHLNDLVRNEGFADGEDPERGSLVADLEALASHLSDRRDVLFESHLAHHLPVDRTVVLRCHPAELRGRLLQRGADAAKAAENAEAEALDVVLSEAVETQELGNVFEIDTTDRTPAAVAADVEAVVAGEREPSAGDVDFIEYL